MSSATSPLPSVSATPSLHPVPAAEAPEAGPHRGMLLLCLFALYVVWGSTYLAIRWALEGFPPFFLAGLRFVLAGTLLLGFLRLRGHVLPQRKQWGAGVLIGFLLLVVGNGGVVFAQQFVPSSVAALVVGSMPLWMALFGGLFGQWPGRLERWGLALGFCGIVLLNLGGELRGNLWATFALLLSPVSWAFGSTWMKRLPMSQGLMSTAVQMLAGGVVMLGLSFLLGEHMKGMPGPRALGSFLYLLVFGSLVAFSAYGYLLRHARPSVATSYAYVNPVVAVLLGVFLGGESLSAWGFVAMSAILVAVILLTQGRARAPRRS